MPYTLRPVPSVGEFLTAMAVHLVVSNACVCFSVRLQLTCEWGTVLILCFLACRVGPHALLHWCLLTTVAPDLCVSILYNIPCTVVHDWL
jgi:hypothetical protein